MSKAYSSGEQQRKESRKTNKKIEAQIPYFKSCPQRVRRRMEQARKGDRELDKLLIGIEKEIEKSRVET